MVYHVDHLNMVSSGKNKDVPSIWTYSCSEDTFANILTDGYFNSNRIKFSLHDCIYICGSDENGFVIIQTLTPDVTVSRLIDELHVVSEITFDTGIKIITGAGVPTASHPIGTLYLRTDGVGGNKRLYIASSATGNWVAISTVG